MTFLKGIRAYNPAFLSSVFMKQLAWSQLFPERFSCCIA